ncbi:MAG: hypothetical protein ABF260_06320 [Flavobacteriaceae bacterium]
MKNIFITSIFLLSIFSSFSQSPEKISYQAIIRNSSNILVSNQSVGMKISILQGSTTGSSVYIETHTTFTNPNGLVSIEIGSGSVSSGSMSTINWENGPFFIKTETDPSGGISYSITGISQLLSVPFALHAKTVENDNVFDGDTTYWKLDGTKIFSRNSVGIGKTPSDEFHVYHPNQNGVATFESGDPGVAIALMDASTTGNYSKTTYLESNNKNFKINTNGFNRFLIDSSGKIGVGKQNLNFGFTVAGNTADKGTISTERFGSTHVSRFIARSGRGTILAPQAILSGEAIGLLSFDGFDGVAYSDAGASIWGYSTENFTPTTKGTKLSFFTTANTTTNRVNRLSIEENGRIGVKSSDVYLENIGSGVIIKSPNGNCWRVTVNNSGNLISTAITCP